MTEQDLELLEEYVDEALAPDEVDTLRARLAEDSTLADALAELRAERVRRAAVWSALEPDENEAQRFAARVSRTARQRDLRSRFMRTTRLAGAAAACVLVGLFVGWLGRERGDMEPAGLVAQRSVSPAVMPVPSNFVVAPPTTPRPTPGVQITEIRYNTPRGPIPMLLVNRVITGAAGPGTELREGDLLLSVDGQPVRDVGALSRELGARPGARKLQIVRDGIVRELIINIQHQR